MEDYFKRFLERQPKIHGRYSNLWRGYLATFEVDRGTLFLKDIEAHKKSERREVNSDLEWRSVLADVVPGSERLKVDWVTGLLVLPYGEVRQLKHIEYDCTLRYEGYLVLEITGGQFVRSKKVEGFDKWTAFRERLFKAFRKTQDYRDLVKAMRNDGRGEDSIDPIISGTILDRSKKILVK